ncbi:MAG: hypothetical protein E7055_13505 [Lentisphaerae bacterium]|nr:hypothetical protein [Lentisphaerota bacterium]
MSNTAKSFSGLYCTHYRQDAIAEKARELDQLLCSHAPTPQIKQFFCRNREMLIDVFQKMNFAHELLAPKLIEELDHQHVRDICRYMTRRHGQEYHVYIKLFNSDAVIRSNNCDAAKKALLWNLFSAFRITSFSPGIPEIFFSWDIFSDRIYALYPQIFRDKMGKKYDFIKNRMLESMVVFQNIFSPENEIKEAIDNDQVSFFEIDRQLHGKEISKTMLIYLLHHNAVKCFMHLLVHYPAAVYRYRTPEEWLFTVCRCCPAKMAIPIISEIEKDKPGIVAKARDPWGNTLLWNTFQNLYSTEKIQKKLIFLGCDPAAENQWGLSYRIVKENTL